MGRFISPDDPSNMSVNSDSSISANLYAYCNNNPVMNSDPTGMFAVPANILALTIDAIILIIPFVDAENTALVAESKIAGSAGRNLLIRTYYDTVLPIMLKITVKLQNVLGSKIVSALNFFLGHSTNFFNGIFPFGVSIGGIFVWALTLIRPTYKQNFWFYTETMIILW